MKTIWKLACLGLLGVAGASADIKDVSRAFIQSIASSMSRMDRDMAAAPMSGNVDHDFATMMIPHHRGAIDMAKAELSYGKDPIMRRLAQEIIVDQQSEIDAMNLRLAKPTLSTGRE